MEEERLAAGEVRAATRVELSTSALVGSPVEREAAAPPVTGSPGPLWRAALYKVLAAYGMHLDATSLPVLDRDTPSGFRLGCLWGYVGADVVGTRTDYTAL